MKFFSLLLFLCLSLPGFAQEDDEQMIEKLEAERRQQAEMAIKLNETQENIKSAAFNAPEELKKLGYETVDAAAMMDEKVVKIVKRMLAESPLKNTSEQEVKDLILEKVKGQWSEEFLRNNPKLMNFFVDILRDEKALSSLVGIFLRRDDLKLYGGIWLGLIILGWLFKKIFFNKKWPRGKAFVMNLLVSISVTTISLTTFYHIFYEEVSPAAHILAKHWKRRNLKT